MPFARPTLTALRQQAMTDVTSSDLPNADGFLRRSVLRVLAWVQAGMAHLHYGYLDWIARMSVPFTAAGEFLVAWGALVGVNRKGATQATGFLAGTGTPAVPIPSGAEISRSDGVKYISIEDAQVGPDGTFLVAVRCLAFGAAGNCFIGTSFVFSTPVSGVQSGLVAADEIVGGAEPEQDDALRTRVLLRYSRPPSGGAKSDYLIWALEVPGVTRAWVDPTGGGPGTVVVYTMHDIANVVFAGFPQGTDGVATAETRGLTATGDQLIVANHIYPLRPVTAKVICAAPVPEPIEITIEALENDTEAARVLIAAALVTLLREVGEVGGVVYPSQLEGAIASVPGIGGFAMPVPLSPVALSVGALPVLGEISYT